MDGEFLFPTERRIDEIYRNNPNIDYEDLIQIHIAFKKLFISPIVK